MKKILTITLMMLITVTTVNAQTERRIYTSRELKSMQSKTEEEKLTKQQKQQLEAMQDSIAHAEAIKALETLEFCLEADRLIFKRGQLAYVTANTNFVSLSDDKAVVQVAPFNDGRGPNGVGGITLEGRASNIHIKTDKKGNTTFKMSVMGTGLSATVNIRLPNNGNKASVTVDPTFSSNRVTFQGELIPLEKSTVFKGRSL